jgi:hypothetical protein
MDQPELEHLPAKLKGKVQELYPGPQSMSTKIEVTNSATLCTVPPWPQLDSEFNLLQTVRATSSLYDKPWFDNICVKGEDATGQPVTWYAQIRLLFSYEVSNGEKAPFMFVKWYEEVKTSDILSRKFGCTRLREASASKLYDVLPLSAAIRRIYVVQDFKVPGHYHVSTFKWDRSPVALTPDAVDQEGNIVRPQIDT